MTAPRPRPAGPAAEEAVEIIAALTEVLDARMTKANHPAQLFESEHRGVCPPYECSLRCREYRALFVRAKTWLDEHEAPAVEQLALVEAR